jgi:hypothetical protein
VVKLTPERVRPWWLLSRDVLLFGLGMAMWVNETWFKPPEPREALVYLAGAAAMALPFGIRQDEKTPVP